MDKPQTDILAKACAWCARQYSKRRVTHEHPSFLAGKILEEANEKFGLASFGVEGWATDCGRSGYQYLNFGDSYDATIVVRSSPHSVSFYLALGGWATYA